MRSSRGAGAGAVGLEASETARAIGAQTSMRRRRSRGAQRVRCSWLDESLRSGCVKMPHVLGLQRFEVAWQYNLESFQVSPMHFSLALTPRASRRFTPSESVDSCGRLPIMVLEFPPCTRAYLRFERRRRFDRVDVRSVFIFGQLQSNLETVTALLTGMILVGNVVTGLASARPFFNRTDFQFLLLVA